MPELKIAIRTACLKLPLKKALHTAAALGATGVEIDARTELRPIDLTETAARELRKLLDDLNLRVSSVRFQTHRGYDVVADLDRRVDATKQAMRMAYRLGATCITNQIGTVPEDSTSAAWQQLKMVMDDLGRFGAHVGAVLAAETGTEPGSRLTELLGTAETGFVGVALNPANWILNDFDVSANASAVANLTQLVIARDAVRDLAARRGIDVLLGQGSADYPALLGLLEDHQYRGWFVVDRSGDEPAAAALHQAITYLRNL